MTFMSDRDKSDQLRDLELSIADLATQDALYQPTAFWADASEKMADQINTRGVENFRKLDLPLLYFVPTYGYPGNGFTQDHITSTLECAEKYSSVEEKQYLHLKQFFDGTFFAMADYRTFLGSNNEAQEPFLHGFSESGAGNPVEQFEFDGKRYSRSALNYLLGLTFLKKHLGNQSIRNVLEIGGGFGTLGEIFCKSGTEGMRYIDVDIPPTSYVATWYLQQVFGQDNVLSYSKSREMDTIPIEKLPAATVLNAWQIEKLTGPIDLFVNFISFQEMEPHIVKNYCAHVSRLGAKWVLLRNLREGKQIRKSEGGPGVDEPIYFDDYIAMFPDYEFVGRNVLPFGFKTVDGFHSELLLLKRKP
jgi:putative sugar O-methyltransferase